MTKRDSQFAELPSPRTLNMESRDIDMPIAGPHSYAAPAIPGPDSHPQAASSTTLSSNTPPQIPPLPVPDGAYRSRPRQRVGHSILFKILEQTLPSGRVSREILVEETDAHGYTHPKSLELFFNGIIGQCLTTPILSLGRITNRSNRPHPHLLHPALLRKRRRRSRSRSCRWLGS